MMANELDRIPPDWQEWWLERAAILEYEALLPRAIAETAATRLLLDYLDTKKGSANAQRM